MFGSYEDHLDHLMIGIAVKAGKVDLADFSSLQDSHGENHKNAS